MEDSRRLRAEEDRKLEELRRKTYDKSGSDQKRYYKEPEVERSMPSESKNSKQQKYYQ